MLTELFVRNLAATSVIHGGMDAPNPETIQTLTVNESDGIFPVVHRGVEQFHFVDRNPESSGEVFRCIATDGNHWTVVRGADGTEPVTHQMKFQIRQIVPSSFFQRIGAGSTTELINAATVCGADPTGETDSLGAITSALSSGPVYLPSGRYRLNSTLNILPGSVLLSVGSVVLYADSSFHGNGIIELISGEKPIRLEGFTLDGSALGAGAGVSGIVSDEIHNEVELRRIHIEAFPDGGIACREGFGWYLERVTCKRNYGTGFWLSLDEDSLLVGCRAIGNFAYGFDVRGGELVGCRARGNVIEDFRKTNG